MLQNKIEMGAVQPHFLLHARRHEDVNKQISSPASQPCAVSRIEERCRKCERRSLGRPGHEVLGVGTRGGARAALSDRNKEQLQQGGFI